MPEGNAMRNCAAGKISVDLHRVVPRALPQSGQVPVCVQPVVSVCAARAVLVFYRGPCWQWGLSVFCVARGAPSRMLDVGSRRTHVQHATTRKVCPNACKTLTPPCQHGPQEDAGTGSTDQRGGMTKFRP